MEISKGNIIEICGEKYDVMNLRGEIDKYDTEKNEFVGEHTSVELHKFGEPSLYPTHLLKIYKDNQKEGILFRMIQNKPPEWIEKPRQRVMMFNYFDERRISVCDIKRIPD